MHLSIPVSSLPVSEIFRMGEIDGQIKTPDATAGYKQQQFFEIMGHAKICEGIQSELRSTYAE